MAIDWNSIEGFEIIGADGVYVGAVDSDSGDRIRLANDSEDEEDPRYLLTGLVADVEGETIRLSATAANAIFFEEGARSQ